MDPTHAIWIASPKAQLSGAEMDFARTATWSTAIKKIDPSDGLAVPLADFLRRGQHFADFCAFSLRQSTLAEFLSEAAKCAAAACNAPMAKVLQLDEPTRRLTVIAEFGLGADAVGRDAGLAEVGNPPGQALVNGEPVVVSDLGQWPQSRVPELLVEFHVVTSINIPLIGRSGPFGILEVDYRQNYAVGPVDVSFLAAVASVAAEGVEIMSQREALTLERDLKDVLLREQQHRIRNNFQSIADLLSINAVKTKDEAARQGFQSIERRVFALASMYDHLLGLHEQRDKVDLSRYLGSLCDDLQHFYALKEQGIALSCNRQLGVMVDLNTCTTVGTVVNELVANSIEHAFPTGTGRIEVSLTTDAHGAIEVRVSDDGIGAKTEDCNGTGLQTARRLIAHTGGNLALWSAPDHGSKWTITLPSKIRS
jgi:two-component sensor histidine kinase